MEYNRALIGERLKELRIDSGFTQSYVAEQIDVPQATISEMEKGCGGGFTVFINLLNFYGKYHKVSNILLTDFVLMKKDDPTYIDEIQSKIVKEIEDFEKIIKTRLLNIKVIAGGVNNEV